MPSPDKAVSGLDLAAARRQLLTDGLGISISAVAFAIVYGVAARQAGFSLVETSAMSVLVFAGAAQFAAVGLVVQGVPWLGIVLLTGLLNARHALYSAAIAPWFAGRGATERAAAAYGLTDEAFALVLPLFRRLRRLDARGYVIAVLIIWIPWNLATVAGYLGGQLLPDPYRLGLDVVFAAAMAGLAAGLVTGRRELVSAMAGVAAGVPAAILSQWSVGIVVGGLVGPLVAMLVPARSPAPGASAPPVREDDAAAGLP